MTVHTTELTEQGKVSPVFGSEITGARLHHDVALSKETRMERVHVRFDSTHGRPRLLGSLVRGPAACLGRYLVLGHVCCKDDPRTGHDTARLADQQPAVTG